MTIIPFPVKATEAKTEAVKNTCLSLTTYNHQDAVPRHRGFFRVFCSHCKMFICYRPTEGVSEGGCDISHGSHKECSQFWLAAQINTIEKLQSIAV